MRHIIILTILTVFACQSSSQLQNEGEFACACYKKQTSESFDEKFSNCASNYIDNNKSKIVSTNSSNLSEEKILADFTLNLMDSLLINCDEAFNEMDILSNKQYQIGERDSLKQKISYLTSQLERENIDSAEYQLTLLNRSKYYISSKLYDKAIKDLDKIPSNSKLQFDVLRTKAFAQSKLMLFEEAIETYKEINPRHKGDEQAMRIYITLIKAKLKRSR